MSSKMNLKKELMKKNKIKATPKNNSTINIIRIGCFNLKNMDKKRKSEQKVKNNKDYKKSKFNKNKKEKSKKDLIKSTNNYYRTSKETINIKTFSKKENKIMQNDIEYKHLNDEELNTLDYDLAILIDKRSYLQYYWSLLKKKQLILFTFIPAKDYNLFSIKICLLLLSFSLYFTINGFFFSDDTMHKIHEDKGKFNIIYQIPQILYSTIISGIINMILKLLSLSEKNIIAIKQIKDIKRLTNYSKSIKRCITIKFIIFFLLNALFLSFFWYFITCFCAVYRNTQMILIKDTLFSFALSMLYPFGLNLIPGMFRIPALRSKRNDKRNLYKFSVYISLIL